jgi:serine/threonine protein kinase
MFASTQQIEGAEAKAAAPTVITAKVNPPQPILNGKYLLLDRLGEGNTSKVYLG